MPLPLGQWKINSNGMESYFLIEAVSPVGAVSGSFALLPGNNDLTGLWNEAAQELTFSAIPVAGAGNAVILPYMYKGYLFSTPGTPMPGQDVVWTLTGYVQVLDDAINTLPNITGLFNARRSVFGWFAQITVIS